MTDDEILAWIKADPVRVGLLVDDENWTERNGRRELETQSGTVGQRAAFDMAKPEVAVLRSAGQHDHASWWVLTEFGQRIAVMVRLWHVVEERAADDAAAKAHREMAGLRVV